jgi:hypothetical protein
MPDDTYAIEIDDKTGRAFVDVTGAVDASKIKNTFLDIVSNKNWHHGDRSILWMCEKASFRSSFKFSDVFDTTRTTKLVAGKGKSAILLLEIDRTVKMVAEFYRGIAVTKTQRMIEIFYSRDEAIAWLDT